MNLDQLRYICAIYETGSISRAAEKLYLSQPNISNAVSRLERELGFSILQRSHNGVRFTDRGVTLAKYAKHIVEECESIQKLVLQPEVRHLRILAPHYTPVDNAFIELCAELERSGELAGADLHLTGMNWVESLPVLREKRAELSIACVPEQTVHSAYFQSRLKQNGVQFYPIASSSVVAKLSENHPLLKQTPFPFERLSEYPMTEYSTQVDSLSAYGNIKLPFACKPSCIYVDSGRTRSALIARTNAWGIAMKLPQKHDQAYGIRCVEVPDSVWSIGYLRDPARPEDTLETRFLALLRAQLLFLQEE